MRAFCFVDFCSFPCGRPKWLPSCEVYYVRLRIASRVVSVSKQEVLAGGAPRTLRQRRQSVSHHLL